MRRTAAFPFVFAWFLGSFVLEAATTTQLSQWGITFKFDRAYEFGRFANGDYWVVGPVTITEMTPGWDGRDHGWEVNPAVTQSQGFYGGGYNYDASKRPGLPLTVTPTKTVVKVIGRPELATGAKASNTRIKTAMALTVLSEAPPGGGAGYFRPPYSGTEKPLIPVTDIQWHLLPSLPPTANAPSLAEVTADFSKCLRLEHHPRNARQFRPSDAFFNYQPENTRELNNTMLRLMLNDSQAAKTAAMIQFTQYALDYAYHVKGGLRMSGTGHDPNHRIVAAWAAVFLNLGSIKSLMATADGFHEDVFLYRGSNANRPLWGEDASEKQYWDYINGLGGSRSNADPYEWIDGGKQSGIGASYQNITSQSLKGQALVGRLIPELQACFPRARWNNLNEYAERWVTVGSWTKPDPYNRFISLHGSNRDGGQYKSPFVASMWNQYANVSGGPPQLSASAGENQRISLPTTSTTLTGSYYPGGGSVTVQWSKVSGPGTVTFSAASALTTTATFPGTGTFVLRFTATSSSESASDDVTVVVQTAPDTTAPTVQLMLPTAGSTLSNIVTLTANASDNAEGGIANVTFLVDGVVVGTADQEPYSVSWNSQSVHNGTRVIRARAVDASGNEADSAPVSVTVENPIADLAGGLIAHYRFDGNSSAAPLDASGFGNDGVLMSGATLGTGKLGNGVFLDGAGAHFRVPSRVNLEQVTSGITISAWVKLEANGKWQAVARKLLEDGTHVNPYSAYDMILTVEDEETLIPRMSVTRTDGTRQFVYADAPVDYGDWVQLVGTYDGTTIAIYVNGVPSGTTPFSGAIMQSQAPLLIGRNGVGGDLLKGGVDDFRLYNVALTAEQVEELYYSSRPSVPTGVDVTVR